MRHQAAEFVVRESSPASLITITRVMLAPSGKLAHIYFTTLPEAAEDTALKFLTRKGSEFVDYVRNHTKIGIIPTLRFEIDYGERNRQRLDQITLP